MRCAVSLTLHRTPVSHLLRTVVVTYCLYTVLGTGHLYARTLLRRPGYYSYRQQSDVLIIHHNGHSPCNGGKKRSSGCSDW